VKISFRLSIAAIVFGAYLILTAQMGANHARIDYVGAALACTGLITLTVIEIITFKKT
jgi:hypothetical protein